MLMKMERKFKPFDKNKIKKLLQDENEFIIDLFTTHGIRDKVEELETGEVFMEKQIKFPILKKEDVKTDEEPNEQEIDKIKQNKIQTKKKTKVVNKDKRKEKKMKKEKNIKKTLTSIAKANRNEKAKEVKVKVEDLEDIAKPVKPIYNQEGKLVFSKIDFTAPGVIAPKNKKKKRTGEKIEKDPKKLLQNLKMEKKQLNELTTSGQTEKVTEIKTNAAWKRAFAKVEGKVVKDDPKLLIKTIKKKKHDKLKSKVEWQQRKEKIDKDKDQRQKKRNENLQKRVTDKKNKKLKTATKRGKIIPGF